MSFYPTNYEVKDTPNDYMKLNEGEHRVRILCSPIIGHESWTEDNKPQRFKTYQEAVNAPSKDGNIREFHAFIVWDYATEMVRVLNITQKTIQKWVFMQTQDEDWADPTQYDIVIKRIGKTKDDTEYTMTAKLPKPMSQQIKDAFSEVRIVPNNYFTGGHPIVRSDEPIDDVETTKQAVSEEVADSVPF